jgi:hypothetical protein
LQASAVAFGLVAGLTIRLGRDADFAELLVVRAIRGADGPCSGLLVRPRSGEVFKLGGKTRLALLQLFLSRLSLDKGRRGLG